jgi:hypothetical protein
MENAKLLKQTKEATSSFERWFDEKVKPNAANKYPPEFDKWRKELSLIQTLVDHPGRVQLALVGTTGSGKSTFLNAVLGQEILPVGVMRPCTAFVTSVRHSSEPGYSVNISFCSQTEWESDLRSLITALEPGEDDQDGENRAESRRLLEAARKRIQAVYNIPADEAIDPDKLAKRPLPIEIERVFQSGSSEDKSFDDAKSMLAYLKSLVRGESSLWPLIKQVNVSGPYPCLAGGLELIDLPGLNDPNEARVEVTRGFLRTSPFVWVVFPMVRGLTEDIHRILREEKLLRTLVLTGTYGEISLSQTNGEIPHNRTYGALSLVGTKADDIDMDAASQFGLPEDCTMQELIEAYREQTIVEAPKQLEQMVRDLAGDSEDTSTLERMLAIARNIRVHATSANAYIKIMGIARRRKDYGIDDEIDTGIPGVHQHLSEISAKAGAQFNAQIALARLSLLEKEILFFFRARAQAPTAERERARNKLQEEWKTFSGDITGIQKEAKDRLGDFRTQFLEKLDPLFKSSVDGEKQSIDQWQGIHWATLRATVNHDGVFRSPSTGRSFDFNEDLAEPLLKQLPLSWERYFTDDLGQVSNVFQKRLKESTKNYCNKINLIIELLFNKSDTAMEQQLAWFQDKVSTLATSNQDKILSEVRDRRMQLAAGMTHIAKQRMQDAYDAAKEERGAGMKKRILALLEKKALDSAPLIYSTIQDDLLEGLNELETVVIGMFSKLTQAAKDHAQTVADNANIDIDEASIDPVIADLLDSAITDLLDSVAKDYETEKEID